MPLKVRFRRLHPDAVMPTKAHADDAAFDLTATTVRYDRTNRATIYGTGLAFDIPKGHAMFIYPRSSSFRHSALMYNSVAVIDSGYHGEVHIVMKGLKCEYSAGERIAQAIIMPIPDTFYEETDEEFTDSERGTGGLGSTGVKPINPYTNGRNG